jgi:hypothetical protein
MQKSIYFIFTLIVLCTNISTLSAQKVTLEAAKEKAAQFLTKLDKTNAARKAPRKDPQLLLANKRDEFYIFNDKTNGGYVIVSGDERVPSILGYSERGEIDNNIPDNMRAWLQEYANQIDYLKKHSSVNTRTAASRGPAISPLLGETSWGQQDPFNLFCPEYEGKRTITGCVSTAMAQIMNYYSWPDATTKEIPGYKTETLELPVSSIPVSSIDWNNMLPSYNSGSETQIQKEAVARLMLMCGTALNMDYRLDGSSSSLDNVSFALKEYFDYAKNLKVIRQGNYSLNSWNQIIYKELAAGRPVCCSGENADEEGHAFVVDGYDKDDYFHVNWGWYGLNNGYFLLSLLDPNMIGEGYNRYQVGIIGIKRSIDMNPEGYNDGDLIVAKTVEGVDMTFEIISAEDMTCEVRGNDNYKPAIDSKTSGTVTIPEEVNGYKVTSIGWAAFYECAELQKIIIPQTVTKIGPDAFLGCRKLESADIPSSVKSIDYQAFMYCKSLTSFIIPDGVTEIPYNMLTATNFTSVIPPGYERKGKYVIIPESVTRIIGASFICDSLESVVLPAGVKEVGGNMACASFGNPFAGCNSLRDLRVEEGNPYYHADGNCIIETATNCISIGCNYSVIPSYAKHIGQMAFCGLDFTDFVVPEGIISVEESAFQSWILKEVTLPSTITSLNQYAFYFCNALETLRVKMKTPIAIDNIFLDNALENLYVPVGTKALYEAADGWKDFKNIIEMETKPIMESQVIDFTTSRDTYYEKYLGGSIVDNLYFNIPNWEKGGYSDYDGCIKIYATSNFMNSVSKIEDLFEESFREQFTGIAFKVPAGNGTIKVLGTSEGNMQLTIKIGNSEPKQIQVQNDLVAIPYDVEYETDVYIYGSDTEQARNLTRSSTTEGSVMIYQIGIEIDTNNSGIVDILKTEQQNVRIYSPSGKLLNKPQKGVNIIQLSDGKAKKIIIK